MQYTEQQRRGLGGGNRVPMSILFQCTECQRPLNVKDGLAGKPGICPNCYSHIDVPSQSEIQANEFRNKLNQWTRQQQQDDPGEDEPDDDSIDQATTTEILNERNEPEAPPVSANSSGTAVLDDTPANTKLHPVIDLPKIDSTTDQEKRAPTGNIPDILLDTTKAIWYVRPPSGGQFGPATGKLVGQWIDEGRVTGDTYVWRQGWDNWRLASDVIPSVAQQVTVESLKANSDQMTAVRTRTAYMKAKRRRTMLNTVGLIVGTIIIIALLIVLFFYIRP